MANGETLYTFSLGKGEYTRIVKGNKKGQYKLVKFKAKSKSKKSSKKKKRS
ncbi:hypothetical protein [Methanocaldococcus fervens]|uniref:Uncharacterized protein n=1 Tax=Methanocaldococcus fervens (strain DSM 4213 / JCM 15782 / AG86) TaxID=573064 RepID=C7P9N7_METFA|nr:hypothetical protein [Methanocaldococcus fervens]ACV25394.1 hypothetical protein Mefer_1591 [Methanocaldococcus fervens AG86]